jgi:hypothetical protein
VPSGQLARLYAYFRFVCLIRSTGSDTFFFVRFNCSLEVFMALAGIKDYFKGFVGNFSTAAATQDEDFLRVSGGRAGERE